MGCLGTASEPGNDPIGGPWEGICVEEREEELKAKDRRQHKSREKPMLLQIIQATLNVISGHSKLTFFMQS